MKFFIAPAEGCRLRLLQVGPSGPSRGPVGLDEFSGKCFGKFCGHCTFIIIDEQHENFDGIGS